MQHKFISAVDGGAHKLILFFNGWAMTPVTVEHLSIPKGYDVLIFWDYRDDEAVELDFMAYEEVRVVAWSMGVWAADRYLQSHLISAQRCTRQLRWLERATLSMIRWASLESIV